MRLRLAAIGFALPAVAHAQYVIGTRDSLTARVDMVFRAFDRVDSPGCAVGVYRDGRILYARGYGMANLELGVPNTPRTVFDVGSISKEFTATAVLLLAQDGKLSLNDDIRRYFPEMPAYASGVTIRNLLNHTSGIRDYLTLMNIAGRSPEGPADTTDFLRLITRSAETNFPIGTRYLYSNSGFALLGQLVYRVSGKSLPQFLAERVFAPLGMSDSRSMADHRMIIANRAQGYAPEGGGFVISASAVDGTGGAGSVHTTVEDFARWDHNWDEPTVGGRALVDSLQVRGKLKNDSIISYALGVIVDKYRGLRTVSHGGSWAGYRAAFLRFPDQHLSVTTFCNLSTSGPDTLARKTATVYLSGKMTPDTVGAWDSALTSAPTVSMSAEALRPYAGAWRNVELGEVRITRLVGDSLIAAGGGTPARLVPIGPNRFRLGRTSTDWTFDGGGAAPTRLRARTRGGTTTYERVPLQPLTAVQLAEYAGDYRSPEVETTNTFVVDNGRVIMMRGGRRIGTLVSVSRDLFVAGGSVIEFTRDARGRITGYVLESGRVRGLKFVRGS